MLISRDGTSIDFVYGGQASAQDIVDRLLAVNGDVGMLRPWRCNNSGKTYVTLMENGKEINVYVPNATATLRKDEWIAMDAAVLRVARERLRLVADLQGAGLTFNVTNGLGKTVLQYERMSDINDATISMDGLRIGDYDRPEFDTVNLPLPIIHKDWQFSLRQLLTSRNGGSPLDFTMAEGAGRKVAECAEKLCLGRLSTYQYGGGTIFGLTNYTGRITKTITSPEDSAWTPATLLSELLDMRALSQAAKHYGPWQLYFSLAWDKYLDNDFSSLYPGVTLRERINKVENFGAVRTLDYLTNYDIVMVEMSSQTVRIVNAMGVTTLQWDEVGGLRKNFKVMCIIVPQLRADIEGNTGIVHGSAA